MPMDHGSIHAKVSMIVEQALQVEGAPYFRTAPDTLLVRAGLKSSQTLTLCLQIEKEFQVTISDFELSEHFHSINKIVDFVAFKLRDE